MPYLRFVADGTEIGGECDAVRFKVGQPVDLPVAESVFSAEGTVDEAYVVLPKPRLQIRHYSAGKHRPGHSVQRDHVVPSGMPDVADKCVEFLPGAVQVAPAGRLVSGHQHACDFLYSHTALFFSHLFPKRSGQDTSISAYRTDILTAACSFCFPYIA